MTTRRIVTCCALALLLGSCRALAPTSPAPEIAQPGAATEARRGIWEVSACNLGDSLEIAIYYRGAKPRPLAFQLGLDTDGNQDTGAPYAGGPDYLAGFGIDDTPNALGRFEGDRDGAWTWALVGHAGWHQAGNRATIRVAWSDLPPLGPDLPWFINLYNGDYNAPDGWALCWNDVQHLNGDAVAL